MSSPFTDADIANMRATQEAWMYLDTATYISPAGVSTTGVSCSFTERGGLNRDAESSQTNYANSQIINAELRLTSLTPAYGGRFTITSRFGEDVTAKTFEIVEINTFSPFGFICLLKEVIL